LYENSKAGSIVNAVISLPKISSPIVQTATPKAASCSKVHAACPVPVVSLKQ
jgi:hypothetical protein